MKRIRLQNLLERYRWEMKLETCEILETCESYPKKIIHYKKTDNFSKKDLWRFRGWKV